MQLAWRVASSRGFAALKHQPAVHGKAPHVACSSRFMPTVFSMERAGLTSLQISKWQVESGSQFLVSFYIAIREHLL